MRFLSPVKTYVRDLQNDTGKLTISMATPISRNSARYVMFATVFLTVFMCISIAYAQTPLFDKLKSGAQTLLDDAQDLVGTLATLALIICILGVFIASMLGPKATATMTTGLKFVIGFFIFWTLIPVILSTIEQLFGSGSTGGS